jgi:hypothetical protein
VGYLSAIRQNMRGHRTSRATFSTLFTAFVLAGLILIGNVQAWNIGTAANVPIGMDGVGFPTVAIDDTGYVHVAWMKFSSDFKDGAVYYIRGRLSADGSAVSWEGVQQPLGDIAHRSNPPRVVARGNTVFLAYGTTNGDFVLATNRAQGSRGNWVRQRSLPYGSNAQNFGMDIGVDAQGTTYLTWGAGFGSDAGSSVLMAYQPLNGAWIGPRQISANYTLARSTRVAVKGSGATATVHVVWEYQIGSNSTFVVGYSRGARDGNFNFIDFSRQVTGSSEGGAPSVAIGPNNRVAIAFIKEIRRGAEYNMRFALSTNDGVTWPSQALQLGLSPSIWPGASWLAIDNASAHIVAEQKFNLATEFRVTYQSYDLVTGQASSFVQISGNENSGAPRLDISAAGKIAVFAANGIADIKYNSDGEGDDTTPVPTVPTTPPTNTPVPASPTPTPEPVPSGSIELIGTNPDPGSARDVTTDTSVSVEFNVNDGIAGVSYQLSNDGQTYTDFAPLASETVSWELASPGASPACTPRSVYARLQNQFGTSERLADSILLDPGVDVSVDIRNPYLSSNPPSTGGGVQDLGTEGASAGDPNYTRALFYYGQVLVGPGECSGVQAARFGQFDAVTEMTYENHGGDFPLVPANDGDGQNNLNPPDGDYNVTIQVIDGVGNQRNFTDGIILDRSAPQILNPDEVVLAPLDAAGNPINGVHESVLVTLSFENMAITDETFGERNQQNFWGVWVANSEEQIVITETMSLEDQQALDELEWSPIPINNATVAAGSNIYSLSVSGWSVVGGQLPNYNEQTDHYIYARVLDGAGNASSEVLGPFEVTLVANPGLPTLYLPAVTR